MDTNPEHHGGETPAPYASVLIPTRNPGAAIEPVLDAVFRQQPGFEFEVIIVDSGSTQAELDSMGRYPVRLHRIQPHEFGHGRTRNRLASLARGEVLLYLSQDAEPASDDWMARLIAPLSEPQVAGAYARQLPRPDADPLTRFFLGELYGPEPARRKLDYGRKPLFAETFFSNVSSAIKRTVWQQVPFRDVIMSEDQYWAYDALRAGYQVVYHSAAAVYHSHGYSIPALFARNRTSGRSLRNLIADTPGGVARNGLSYVLREAAFLVGSGRFTYLPYALLYETTRSAGFTLGMLEGSGATSRASDIEAPVPG